MATSVENNTSKPYIEVKMWQEINLISLLANQLLILVHFVGFPADILTVVGAVIIGYATCMLQLGFGSTSFSKTVCFTSIGFVKTEISKLWHFACCNHIMSTLFCFILDAYCMLLSQNMSPNLLSFQNQDFKFTSYSVFKVEYFLFFKCLFTCEGVRWKGRLPSFKGLFGLINFFFLIL